MNRHAALDAASRVNMPEGEFWTPDQIRCDVKTCIRVLSMATFDGTALRKN